MPDWTKSMQQQFEYYVVDPGTWKDASRLDTVTSSIISRDLYADTLGSATIDIVDSVGECYIRTYLITIQNGIKEKFPLGTYLVQTPSSTFDGKIRKVTMDAYSPLIELKENKPPIGFYIPKDSNIMDYACRLTDAYSRAPIVSTICAEPLYGNFVADVDDTWLSFLIDLMTGAKYEYSLDELGRILFSPKQDTASLQPIWTFDDDNSSILYSDITMDHDLYDVPNVVEVVCSNGYYAKAVNDDVNSPVSTVRRGREICRRITDPNIGTNPLETAVEEYARLLLKELSSIEYTVTYTHAYCPVRIGDCVRLNYKRAGLTGIKAKVISQSIKCEPGCPVTEKAVFTTKLWG